MALGKVAYFGPTSKVTNFWLSVGKELECPQTYNPADHAIMSLSMVDDNKQVNLDRIAVRQCLTFSHATATCFRRSGRISKTHSSARTCISALTARHLSALKNLATTISRKEASTLQTRSCSSKVLSFSPGSSYWDIVFSSLPACP